MRELRLVLQGLRFGMLLQLAVGPVCLFVLGSSFTDGFRQALSAVAAVALVDTAFIALSALGAAALLAKPFARRAARAVGGLVLCLFGADTLLGALGITLLPGIRLFAPTQGRGLFAQALLLTASNPLTILFWGGALAAKVAENHWRTGQLLCFALGCVLATALFLSAVAALGGALAGKLPFIAVRVLNAAVGGALIAFGLRLLLCREVQAAVGGNSGTV